MSAFIAAHAIGQGAVIWVFISEIFPNRQRAFGQSLGSFTHWFFAAALTLVFPLMAEAWAPQFIFGLFCGMMVLQLVWVRFFVPETKGASLEELERELQKTALLLPEIHLNGNSGKIKVFPDLVFDVPPIGFLNILRQIGK